MSTSALAIVKNGTVVLPKNLRKSWKNAEVYVSASEQDIFIKKLQDPSFSEILDAFNKIGSRIPKRYLKEAIKAAREAME